MSPTCHQPRCGRPASTVTITDAGATALCDVHDSHARALALIDHAASRDGRPRRPEIVAEVAR